MLCLNPKCCTVLKERPVGGGYCSRACMATTMRRGDKMSDMLSDPQDITGRKAIASTADEVDAMLEALDVDARLPRIIYMIRRGWSRRKIARSMRCDKNTITSIMEKSPPNLLKRCGLR